MTDAPPSSPAMKAPRDIEDFLIYRLRQLGQLARRGAGAMYARELGISRREWRVLSFLAKYSGCNLTDFARNSGIDTVVASRCVSEMVTRGLVAKAREPGNKRVTVLTLTPHGQSVYDRALTLGCAYNAAFAACLSDSEASLLDDLLGRLEARAVTMNAGDGDADPVDAD